MQTAEPHFSRIKYFLDSRHQRYANTMAELDAIESKIDNLTQHFCAVGVAAGIPTSRERDHQTVAAADGAAGVPICVSQTPGTAHCFRTRASTKSVIAP